MNNSHSGTTTTAGTTKTALTREELEEEIRFFRDFCGWSDRKVEQKLGLSKGTLAQRRLREKREAEAREAKARQN